MRVSVTKATPVTTDLTKDGKISGVDDTMEYSTDGGKTWTPVPEGAKSVIVKKSAVSLKKGKTFKISASIKKVKPKKILILTSHAPRLRYVSANPSVAKVNGKGVITAKNPGTCYVYAVATNGVRKGVKLLSSTPID